MLGCARLCKIGDGATVANVDDSVYGRSGFGKLI